MGKKESYKNLYGKHWRRFYIADYFFDKGYLVRVVTKLNDNGERGYRSVMELRQAGNLPAASLDLSGYDQGDPDEAVQALELLLLFQ